ncbi:hypothetical protein K3555_08965 [Leisingera sp. M527]|uniref:hypothetical protein n=1 Tax=Leisingera sp. M527 TaxID=2867014 RepID=UPI0021A972AA|nr:hypothetical protein [Leisingera sp. M527]UWQ34595.1 hypothetical protein K3555_08965 [Leisingera sp. M527]
MSISELSDCKRDLIAIIEGKETFTKSEIKEECQHPGHVVSNVIESLERSGEIVLVARGNGAEVFARSGPGITELAEPSTPTEMRVWDYVSARQFFTLEGVREALPASSANERDRFFRRLKRAGQMKIWARDGNKTFWTVKSYSEFRQAVADHNNSNEGAIWIALRLMEFGTPRDILAAAHPARPELNQKIVTGYLKDLLQAGYLRLQRGQQKLRPDTQVYLARDTGPIAPMKRSVRVMIDENLDKITWAAGGRI